MKSIGYLLFLSLLFSTCTKDTEPEPEPETFITGRVVDFVTQKGIAGIEVKLMYFRLSGWDLWMATSGSDISDSLGNFEVTYTKPNSDLDETLLKLGGIPDGYQQGARINGQNETCILTNWEDDSDELNGFNVKEERTYIVELMPANNYAYIVPPVIPTAWLGDTIVLSTYDWNNPLDGLSGCSDHQATITFPVSSNAMWNALNKPYRLRVGDEVSISYKIYNGNVTKKYNYQEFHCPFNDTTGMVLSFY